jgi:hypothetical protein
LAACLAVEAGVVTGTIQGAVRFVVGKWEALMRACRREANDVAVGANSINDALAKFEQHAGRVVVRITNVQWLVRLEFADVC